MPKKFIYILLLLFSLVGFILLSYWRGINQPAKEQKEEKVFVIKNGEGVKTISENLLNEGLINSKIFFEYYVWQKGWASKIQAGEHHLNTGLSIKELAKAITSGNTLEKELAIRTIEGWNINDINKYLRENKVIVNDEFKALAAEKVKSEKLSSTASATADKKVESYEFLAGAPEEATLEGFLFPDTYRIFKDSSAEDIIAKMLANFDKKLTPALREEIKRQGKTIYEMVIMASLIEKEVKTWEDMEIASGIFWKRLKNGERLQLDATLSYILGDNIDQHSLEETFTESPYNTYRYGGLPPTPICNPGLNALKAAIYPKETEYNFFLTAKVNGEDKVIYAKTFDEHVRNKGRYLR